MSARKYTGAVFLTIFLFHLSDEPLNLGFPILLTFLPLFLIFPASGKARFLYGWLAGFLLQGTAYYWIFFTIRDFSGQSPGISVAGSILFWLYQGLDIALWLWITPILLRALPKVVQPLGAASTWLFLQGHLFPYVFPWDLGAVITSTPLLGGAASFWGARGLTFLIILMQGLLVLPELRTRRKTILLLSLALILLSGHFFKDEVETETWRIGVVQPNLIRWAKKGRNSVDELFLAHFEPSLILSEQQPDLIIWPETALPFELDHYPYYRLKIRELIRKTGAAVLTGTVSRNPEGGYYNEVRIYTPDREEPQIYRKEKLVKFSEQLPWIFAWAKWFDPGLGGFLKGRENRPFVFRERNLVPLICFEALFPEYVYRSQGHLLINLTNDAWFGETKASRQHLRQVMPRTLENGVPLVRATNSGISCWVDIHGKARQAGGLYRPEHFIFEVPIPKTKPTRFSHLGSGLIHLVALVVLLWASLTSFRAMITRPATTEHGPNRSGRLAEK